MLSILLFIFHSYAVPYCEQFDDEDAYNECVLSGKHDTVKLKPEDVDTDEEEACKKNGDSKTMNNCLVRSREKANQKARVREEKERSQKAATDKPAEPETLKCEAKTAKFQCEEAHRAAQTLRAAASKTPISEINDAVADCQRLCSRKTGSVASKFAGCQMSDVKDANNRMFALFATCNKADPSTQVCDDYGSEKGKEKLDVMEKGMVDGTYHGDQQTCNGSTCTTSKDLGTGIKMVGVSPDGNNQGVSHVYYTDSSGATYRTYQEAQNAQSLQLMGSDAFATNRVRESPTYNAEAIGGSSVRGSEVPSSGSARGAAQSVADAGTTDKATTGSRDVQTTEGQNQAGANQPAGKTTPAAATPAATPTSAVAPTNFATANPYSGTAFTGGAAVEANNSFNNNPSYDGDSKKFSSEVTSGANYGDSYGGSSGGYSAPNRRAYRSAEAVGGGSSGGSSTGGGRLGGGSSSGGSGGSSGKIALASADRRDTESLTGPFQNGYHKPGSGEKAAASTKLGDKSAKDKTGKRRRRKTVTDCGGSLNCIAGYLGKGRQRSARGRRGLASLGSGAMNREIGSGYGDIMSTIEKIHNRFEIDQDGNLEVPR